MDVAGASAGLVLTLLAASYKFPSPDYELTQFDVLINFELTLAGFVMISQVLSKPCILTKPVEEVVKSILFGIVLVLMAVLVWAFILKSLEKSNGNLMISGSHLTNIVILCLPLAAVLPLRGAGAPYIFQNCVLWCLRWICFYMWNNLIESLFLLCFSVFATYLWMTVRGFAAQSRCSGNDFNPYYCKANFLPFVLCYESNIASSSSYFIYSTLRLHLNIHLHLLRLHQIHIKLLVTYRLIVLLN